MNEKLIVGLSDLFKMDKNAVIETLNNKEGDDSILNAFKDSFVIKPKEEYNSFITNYRKDVESEFLGNLKEKAKKKELDQELYSFFKGNVAEELERKVSKVFDVSDYDNLDDLLNKIKSKKLDETKLKTEFEELQKINQKLVEEKTVIKKEAETNFNKQLISIDRKLALDSLQLNYPKDIASKRKMLLESQVDSLYNFERDGNRTIVTDKNGNIQKNPNTLEPLTINDVLVHVANEFDFEIKSPESGGQGGSSSQQSINSSMTFDEYREGKNVKAFTAEADKLYLEWKKINK